jgi:SAM-dependent methyltransferase
MARPRTDNERTIDSYESGADVYAAAETSQATLVGALRGFVDDFVAHLWAGARVLEIGSGTGRDAAYLESQGLSVRRTDAARSFVDAMRSRGVEAAVVNVLCGELGGPYDGVWANAVFHHLSSEEFRTALRRLALVSAAEAVLGFTVKQGDGEEWSAAKLGTPRFFRYWQPAAVEALLADSPWQLSRLTEHPGEQQDWLHVLCVGQTSHQVVGG